eukprot:5749295-Amphidinium_carterae.1
MRAAAIIGLADQALQLALWPILQGDEHTPPTLQASIERRIDCSRVSKTEDLPPVSNTQSGRSAPDKLEQITHFM